MVKYETTSQLVPANMPTNQRDVLTPEQLRAARALLGWSRAELSHASGIPVRTIENFETGKSTPLLTTAGKLRRALEREGVEFTDETDDAGPGVRLRKKR